MAILKFKMTDVSKLIAEIEAAKEFNPTMDHLFDASLYKGGVILDKEGLTEAEAEAKGGFFWPSAEHIDKSKVESALQLVGDQGVYLITNAEAEGTPAQRGTVAYAEGCDPDKDDFFYENKRHLFGGDDGSVTIPFDWALWAKHEKKRVLKLKLSSNSVELVQK